MEASQIPGNLKIACDSSKLARFPASDDFVNDVFAFQDAFIGFGGNQVRDTVKMQANWFVTTFYELIDELKKN